MCAIGSGPGRSRLTQGLQLSMSEALTQAQKTFVVQRLAMFRTPSEVVELVNQEFGVAISRQRVQKYHPERNSDLAEVWRQIFYETRKKYVAEVAEIPIAQQAFRLNELQAIYDRYRRQRNDHAARQTLEHAAKEAGNMFTNRRELTGANGKPLLDTAEYARGLYRTLMEEGKVPREKIIQYIVSTHNVPETVLVSDAEN